MHPLVRSVLPLPLSNVFMSFAWCGHLKKVDAWPRRPAVTVSWLIAFFEYLLQVPANPSGQVCSPSPG